MTTTTTAIIGSALMAIGLAGASNAAWADQANQDVTQSVVKYADLNLNSPAGIEVLYRRIERAARTVCQLPLDIRELSISVRQGSCEQQAVARAIEKVRVPALSNYYLAKMGHPAKAVVIASTS